MDIEGYARFSKVLLNWCHWPIISWSSVREIALTYTLSILHGLGQAVWGLCATSSGSLANVSNLTRLQWESLKCARMSIVFQLCVG